jgi:hypothetical protein
MISARLHVTRKSTLSLILAERSQGAPNYAELGIMTRSLTSETRKLFNVFTGISQPIANQFDHHDGNQAGDADNHVK